jgi:hypothetical protein
LYLFSRPQSEDYDLESWETALGDYNQCKSYILDFEGFQMSLSEPDRQVRTHSCFGVCRNGEDPNFKGDDRPECIELEPILRDQLVCLYPEETCESTSVSNPIVVATIITKDKNGKDVETQLLFAFQTGIIAMIIANPF